MTLAQIAARGGASTLLTQAGRFIISFGSSIVLARLLAPHDFGLMAMVAAFTSLAQLLRDSGVQLASSRHPELSPNQHSNLFWFAVCAAVVSSVLVFLLGGPIAGFYGQPEVDGMVKAMAITLLAVGLGSQFRVHLIRRLVFARLNIIEVAPQLVGSAAGIALAMAGASYWALVAQQVVMALTELVLSLSLAGWRPGRPDRTTSIRPVLRSAISINGIEFLSFSLRNADSIALGRTWSSAVVGLYDRAFQIMMIPLYQLNWPLTRVIIPVLVRLKSDLPTFWRYVGTVQMLPAYVTATVYAMCFGSAPSILAGLYGDAWLPATAVLRVLCVVGAFKALSQVPYWAFLSLGRSTALLRFDLIATPVTLVCILLGLPWAGLGVAVGLAVAAVGSWLGSVLWMGRKLDVDIRPLLASSSRGILAVGVPAGVICWVASNLPLPALLELPIGVAAAAIWALGIRLVVPAVHRDTDLLLAAFRLALRRTGTTQDSDAS